MNVADLIWTMLALVFIVGYFMLLFRVVLDVFRRPDLGPAARTAWFVAVFVVPLAGLVAYVVVRDHRWPRRPAAG